MTSSRRREYGSAGVLAGQVRRDTGGMAGGDGEGSRVPARLPALSGAGVAWYEAQEFIRRLNARTGGSRYRLPTEAEWEFAARAGTHADRYRQLDVIARSGGSVLAVLSDARDPFLGQKAPNAWGLHDMLGNVWSGSRTGMANIRAPCRGSLQPEYESAGYGFRLMRIE